MGPTFDEPTTHFPVVAEGDYGLGDGVFILSVEEEGGVADHFGNACGVTGRYGNTARHRLKGRQAEAFVEGGIDQPMGVGVEFGEILLGNMA